MSGSSHSRPKPKPKPKLEPISLEELAGTTGMSGFGTLFTRDLTQSVPVLDQLESSAPGKCAPENESSALPVSALETAALIPAAPVADEVGISALETSAPLSCAPNSSAVETSAPEIGKLESAAVAPTADYPAAPDLSALDYVSYQRRPKIRRAETLAEGHSLAEQAVYEEMFREGKPYQGEHRILTTGLRTLAERVRMAYANCKANVRSLIAKQAIAEYGEGFSYTVGRTYIIYSPEEVMRRRRAAGLTHVIRTRGVAFVDPQTGAKLGNSSALDTSAPESAS